MKYFGRILVLVIALLLCVVVGSMAQINSRVKSVYFENADSTTIRSNAVAAGVNTGWIYYNTQGATKKFRVYANGVWFDLPTSSGALYTAGNGMTLTGNRFDWGGTLLANTSIALGGFNVNYSGTGKVTYSPSATLAGFNPGVIASDPSTLVNADMWYNTTSTDLRTRIGGVSGIIPYVPISSPPVAGQIPFWNGTTGALTHTGYFKVSGGSSNVVTITGASGTLVSDGALASHTITSGGNNIVFQAAGMTANNDYAITTPAGATVFSPAGTVTINTTAGEISNGSYTPTTSNLTNGVGTTTYISWWSRVGSVVTLSGKVDIGAPVTPANDGSVEISLPIASNITLATDVFGSGTVNSIGNAVEPTVIVQPVAGSPGTAKLTWSPLLSVNSMTIYYTLQYVVK